LISIVKFKNKKQQLAFSFDVIDQCIVQYILQLLLSKENKGNEERGGKKRFFFFVCVCVFILFVRWIAWCNHLTKEEKKRIWFSTI